MLSWFPAVPCLPMDPLAQPGKSSCCCTRQGNAEPSSTFLASCKLSTELNFHVFPGIRSELGSQHWLWRSPGEAEGTWQQEADGSALYCRSWTITDGLRDNLPSCSQQKLSKTTSRSLTLGFTTEAAGEQPAHSAAPGAAGPGALCLPVLPGRATATAPHTFRLRLAHAQGPQP